ncbi:MAG TPA: hypothetical protein PKN48_00235 [Bacteroidales bacterium]|nr:hypothetical protein [Bacteroidales bacterium]
MGNSAGARGICYHVYGLEESGSQFIFENGEHCGFSVEEQEIFFNIVKRLNFSYIFTNVIQLGKDFNKGIFNVMKG